MNNKELIIEKINHINSKLGELCKEIEKNNIDYDLDLDVISCNYIDGSCQKNAKLVVVLKRVIS